MRLIDADALLTERKMSKYYHLPNGDIAIPIIDIEHAPTVDAVPVVRCRGCEYVSRERSPESARKFGQLYDCGLGVLASPKADDFCCYGERRKKVD